MGAIKCFFGWYKWVRFWDFDTVFGWEKVWTCLRCGATKDVGEAPEKEE